MRDHTDRSFQPQRRPDAQEPRIPRGRQDLSAELIRKARIATAIHMALRVRPELAGNGTP